MVFLILATCLYGVAFNPTRREGFADGGIGYTGMIGLYESGVGLGDKLFDLVGMLTIGELTHQPAHVYWGREGLRWYDTRIIKINHDKHALYAWDGQSKNPNEVIVEWIYSGRLAPYIIMKMLNYPSEELAAINRMYLKMLDTISVIPIVENMIPALIENCVGVHLRRSDKVGNCDDNTKMSYEDYDSMISAVKEEIKQRIEVGEWTSFFICSEDTAYKVQFEEWLKQVRADVHIVQLPSARQYESQFNGIGAALDFIALSRCKCVVQGIIYSSFSVLAAIKGRVPLFNFTINPDQWWLMRLYKPLLYLIHNGQHYDRVVDMDELKSFDGNVPHIKTTHVKI
jgi:hypothetical protein